MTTIALAFETMTPKHHLDEVKEPERIVLRLTLGWDGLGGVYRAFSPRVENYSIEK